MKRIFTLLVFAFSFSSSYSQIAVTLSVTNISCNGNSDGSIVVATTGGQAPYSYELTDAGGNPFSNGSNNFTNLLAGNYTVKVTDANNAMAFEQTTIVEPSAITATVVNTSPSTPNGSTGAIEITATGGTPPYQYSIDGGNTYVSTPVINQLASGTYTVLVEDVLQCSVSAAVTVTEGVSNPLNIALSVTNISCFGSSDGSIVVATTGGQAPYSYELTDAGGNPFSNGSNNFTGLLAGNYTVKVTDANNSTIEQVATIVEPPVISLVLVSLPTGNEPSGVIEITATGGTPPYQYSLDGLTYQAEAVFSDLQAGSYTITTRDINGCLSEEIVSIDTNNLDNSINRQGDDLVVNFDADTYQWINVDTQTEIAGATNKSFKATETGRYRVEMTRAITARNSNNNIEVFSSPTYEVAVLGVDDNKLESLKIYPNPSSDRINIPSKILNETYTIYSVLGKKLQSGTITSNQVSLKKLPQGIYFLKIKGFKTHRIIKE